VENSTPDNAREVFSDMVRSFLFDKRSFTRNLVFAGTCENSNFVAKGTSFVAAIIVILRLVHMMNVEEIDTIHCGGILTRTYRSFEADDVPGM
jgi:hypothetical protein